MLGFAASLTPDRERFYFCRIAGRPDYGNIRPLDYRTTASSEKQTRQSFQPAGSDFWNAFSPHPAKVHSLDIRYLFRSPILRRTVAHRDRRARQQAGSIQGTAG